MQEPVPPQRGMGEVAVEVAVAEVVAVTRQAQGSESRSVCYNNGVLRSGVVAWLTVRMMTTRNTRMTSRLRWAQSILVGGRVGMRIVGLARSGSAGR